MQFCHFCQVGDKMGYTKSHSSLSLSLSLSFFMKLCLPAFESQIKHDWNHTFSICSLSPQSKTQSWFLICASVLYSGWIWPVNSSQAGGRVNTD